MLETKKISKSIRNNLEQKPRLIVFGINILLAWTVYFFATDLLSPLGSDAGIWVLAAIAYWLLVLVTTPFFSPPKDSLAIAIAVILLLVPIDLTVVQDFSALLYLLYTITIILSILVAVLAIVAIFNQKSQTFLGNISYQLSEKLGRGEILFTPVVIISALGFYQNNIPWIALILGFWTLMVVVRPIELIAKVFLYFKELATGEIISPKIIGSIQRVDAPGIVRVNLHDGKSEWEQKNIHIIHLPNNKRFYILPLFSQVQNEKVVGTGLLCEECKSVPFNTIIGNVYVYEEDGLAEKLLTTAGGEASSRNIAGIVYEGSSIGNIKFQVIDKTNLEEGKIVSAVIRNKTVYYQILEANTQEEHFQQNPLGIQIASAAQLGFYDSRHGFMKFPWLPEMNQPLFMVLPDESPEQILEDNEFIIGNIPSTSFGIPVILDDLIEYHTAILGKTGTAKTELAFDIVREALKRNTKIFCVDFTGEYKARLKDCTPQLIEIDKADQKKLETLLFAIDAKGFKADAEKQQMKDFLNDTINPTIISKIEAFLKENKSALGIFELAEITNTRTTLRITELYLSAIMNWARNNRKKRRVLLVLEEAHTIIPEAYGTFDANTRWVVERIGQIALQGRKYGVGLLLISQRTALVSKTVLSQCHTYLTHELIDKTSLDYLNSVLSQGHVKVIPNLRFLELVAYGKGIKSERPILIKRAYDENKKKASDALNVKDEVDKQEVK